MSVALCNQAYAEAGGNFEKALERLRIKAGMKADRLQDRETSARYVGIYRHHDGTRGAMVALSAETDFVSRSEDFRALADTLAVYATGFSPENMEELLDLEHEGATIKQAIRELSGKTGEKIQISGFAVF